MTIEITPPSQDSFPTVFADWLELRAILSPTKKINISEIRDLIDFEGELDENLTDTDDNQKLDFEQLPNEDLQELDEQINIEIESTVEEISLRSTSLESSYPFNIEDNGYSLSLKQDLTLGEYAYLFCLIISNATSQGLIESTPKLITHIERDLFQICASLCAAGANQGPVVSIGWPRPNNTHFLTHMKATHAGLNPSIIIRENPLPGSPPNVKDGGIDVISWTQETDGHAGIKYYMGQAASGKDWENKSAKTEKGAFLRLYYEVQPVTPFSQMFIPHCITGVAAKGIDFRTTVAQTINIQTERLGFLYYRYRLPKYVALAETLSTRITDKVERFNERDRLKKWVNNFITTYS